MPSFSVTSLSPIRLFAVLMVREEIPRSLTAFSSSALGIRFPSASSSRMSICACAVLLSVLVLSAPARSSSAVMSYKQQSVADFNQSLAPNNGDISGLLDAQADVLASISPDDKNYEFITVTLAASLDELYCEQMNDSVGLSAYLKKEEQPLEKLPGEESVAGAEITYQFVFNALYRLNYTFSDPTQITVAERDSALQKFKTEFQNYVDNLSEADLASSNIKTVLSEKADELENSLSTAKMKLSCEVENVEVHNAGEEIVNN